MTYNYAQDKIRQAVARYAGKLAHDGLGLIVQNGVWRKKPYVELCPIGALIVDTKCRTDDYLYQEDAAMLLGVSVEWVYGWIAGFDGGWARENIPFYKEGFVAGQAFSKEMFGQVGSKTEDMNIKLDT